MKIEIAHFDESDNYTGKSEIIIEDSADMKGFMRTLETFMRRFMTGQYPPIRMGR